MTSKKKDDTGAEVPVPTRGRHVDFTSTEHGAEVCTAVVTKVDGDALHLCVFDPVFGPRNFCASVSNADGAAGTWAWPERV
jgi:hypothetical protein